VDVEVSHDQEGKPKVGKKNFRLDGVDPVVHSIGRIGINNPEGVETGAKKRLIGEDIEGEDFVHPHKLVEHRVVGKKGPRNIGSHSWLPNREKKELETIKGRKVSLVDRWILQKDYRGIGGRLSEQLKQGTKSIPAPKAVMLNNGEKRRSRGRPLTRGRRNGFIIHYGKEHDDREGQGQGSAPPEGEDHQNRE